jgi:predicted RNase H-like nuclease (RuvC/YqgF family)
MADKGEIGFWVGAIGVLAGIVWNVFGFIRHPTFVSRSRIDDLTATIVELRAIVAELRVELVDWKAKHTALDTQLRMLRAEVDWLRDQNRELRQRKESDDV